MQRTPMLRLLEFRNSMLVVLNLGFRPFFLLSGVFAVILMALWIPAFKGRRALSISYGQIGRHSHKMIFGYTAGGIAGFLLTAVRNWTEDRQQLAFFSRSGFLSWLS